MADRPVTQLGERNRPVVQALGTFVFLLFGIVDLVIGHLVLGIVFLVVAAGFVADFVVRRRRPPVRERRVPRA